MIRPGDIPEAQRLHAALDSFEADIEPLPGVTVDDAREVFVAQIIESQRRVRYIDYLRHAPLRSTALDPNSGAYDPLKAAVLSLRANDFDEACWQVFISVHFGKHRRHGWDLASHFYGRLGQGGTWSWATVMADPEALRTWVEENSAALYETGAKFGNHRKYESLRSGPAGTGRILESYVHWVDGSHQAHYDAITAPHATPESRFAAVYNASREIHRFGRAGRFDLVAMLGKQRILDVVADKAYLSGATGPLRGATLLFEGDPAAGGAAEKLEARLAPLCERLSVSFDVLEDAMCNWQKNPTDFVGFRG